tara:strand:+ start:698 stop:1039 length:342 start_codon:yes stop_codon:yes gene_type:complete
MEQQKNNIININIKVIKVDWKDILKGTKDTWVPKRIGSKDNPVKPKMTDRVIAFLKRNPSGVSLPTIMKDADVGNMSSKRLRKFLQEESNISSQKRYVGSTGNSSTLYFWRGD